MKSSERLAAFLDFLREAEQDYHIAAATENEGENATQDILHYFELEKYQYHQFARLAKTAGEVRRQRRQAKDKMQELKPLVDWVAENAKTVKSLERLLGELRKIEKNLAGRSYHPKTEVITKTLGGKDQWNT